MDLSLSTIGLVVITGRWFTGTIAGIAAAMIAPMDVAHLNVETLSVFVAMTLVTMVGFIWNDIYDYELDRSAGKDRPIATGALSRTAAFSASLGVATIALVICLTAFSASTTACLLAILIALALYSPISRSGPLLKPAYVALLSVSPFIFASIALSVPLSLPVIGVVIMYIFFRELLIDTTDIEADRRAGISTLDSIALPYRVRMVAWLGMFLSLGIGIVAVESIVAILLMLCAIAFHVFSYTVFSYSLSNAFLLSRIGMLFAVFSASTGAAGLY